MGGPFSRKMICVWVFCVYNTYKTEYIQLGIVGLSVFYIFCCFFLYSFCVFFPIFSLAVFSGSVFLLTENFVLFYPCRLQHVFALLHINDWCTSRLIILDPVLTYKPYTLNWVQNNEIHGMRSYSCMKRIYMFNTGNTDVAFVANVLGLLLACNGCSKYICVRVRVCVSLEKYFNWKSEKFLVQIHLSKCAPSEMSTMALFFFPFLSFASISLYSFLFSFSFLVCQLELNSGLMCLPTVFRKIIGLSDFSFYRNFKMDNAIFFGIIFFCLTCWNYQMPHGRTYI